MKYLVRLYRLIKPICVYTSYLFTSLILVCLAAHGLSGGGFPVTAELLWGLFLFSLGSIGLQRACLESGYFRASYGIRLFLYICGTGLWGMLCMRLFALDFGAGIAGPALLWPVGLGVLCCVGLELFNRGRARVYNTLLLQYQKRKNHIP